MSYKKDCPFPQVPIKICFLLFAILILILKAESKNVKVNVSTNTLSSVTVTESHWDYQKFIESLVLEYKIEGKIENQKKQEKRKRKHMNWINGLFNQTTPHGDRLKTINQILNVNETLKSTNSEYIAVLQEDGNFVVYDRNGTVKFSTNTDGKEVNQLKMTEDGQVVLYSSGSIKIWLSSPLGINSTSTNMCISTRCELVMQNDGELVAQLSSPDNSKLKLWSSSLQEMENEAEHMLFIESLFNSTQLNPYDFRLQTGQNLDVNSYNFLKSFNGQFVAVLQSDGNFVVYDRGGTAHFATNTRGQKVTSVKLSGEDGRFVLFDDIGSVVWSTPIGRDVGCIMPKDPCQLILGNDGNLAVYASS